MAPPRVFVIDLDNGDRVFFPGDTISGRVTLQTRDVKKLRGIYLTLIGRAKVHWTSDNSTNSDKESYFNFRVKTLWGSEVVESFLQPGSYQFPYSFKLPEVPLPTSFKSLVGKIRYWLEARMDRPRTFDHVTKRAFTIMERVDLNLFREDLSGARRGENQKTLGFFCCETGPLILTASTDRGGYCPGENILVTAHVENNTSKEMKRVKATLYRHITYYARGRSLYSKNIRDNIICKMQTNDRIPAGARGNFECNQQPLHIPACPPSSHTCRMLHIDYELDIEVVVPTFSTNLHVKIPIVIGTEPLRSIYANITLPTIGWGQAEAVNIAENRYTMGQARVAPLLSMVQLPEANEDPPPQYPGNVPAQPAPPYPADPAAQSPPTHLPTEPYPAPYPTGTVQPAACSLPTTSSAVNWKLSI